MTISLSKSAIGLSVKAFYIVVGSYALSFLTMTLFRYIIFATSNLRDVGDVGRKLWVAYILAQVIGIGAASIGADMVFNRQGILLRRKVLNATIVLAVPVLVLVILSLISYFG